MGLGPELCPEWSQKAYVESFLGLGLEMWPEWPQKLILGEFLASEPWKGLKERSGGSFLSSPRAWEKAKSGLTGCILGLFGLRARACQLWSYVSMYVCMGTKSLKIDLLSTLLAHFQALGPQKAYFGTFCDLRQKCAQKAYFEAF